MNFDFYIGIDYSGAATPQSRSATIQVYQSAAGEDPALISSPASTTLRRRNWNRFEVTDWLIERTLSDDRIVIGMDHGFSFPIDYFHRYDLKTWNAFLKDFAHHWPTDREGSTVEEFRSDSLRTGSNHEFRLTERWTSSAKSVFQFDVNGSVAKSTHAGLPLLLRLRKAVKQLHMWPFDGWQVPAGKSVIAETYPSLFRNRYNYQRRTGDQQDAYAVSRWLQEMDALDQLERFFDPPLSRQQKKQAKLEGWILGVV